MSSKDILSFYDIAKSIVPPGYYKGKVISVYDGDTAWIMIALPDKESTVPQIFNKSQIDTNYNVDKNKFIKIKVRFEFIDAPEIRTGNKKKQAKESRDFVRSLIDGKEVYFKVSGMGKYFRHIAEIYIHYHDMKDLVSEQTFNDQYEILGGMEGMISLNKLLVKTGKAVKKKY